MREFKLTTWNMEFFGNLLEGRERKLNGKKPVSAAGKALLAQQRRAIGEQLLAMDPDILCLQEGPRDPAPLRAFCSKDLKGGWALVERAAGEPYVMQGEQYIWFLVRKSLLSTLKPTLLPIAHWQEATRSTSGDEHGESWPVLHPALQTGSGAPKTSHSHYRHPQTLSCQVAGRRVDFIGAHLKSKRVDRYAEAAKIRETPQKDRTDDQRRLLAAVENAAVAARIKLTTEATNIRHFIESRFEQEPDPLVFVLGDFNDGPGKEYFERLYLFHDLVGNLQGDVFFARRFLNHCLFDYRPTGDDSFRWSVEFKDAWEPDRSPRILLDHILFTQALVSEKSSIRIEAHAGSVEHVAHAAANRGLPTHGQTSDHRPVSCVITVDD